MAMERVAVRPDAYVVPWVVGTGRQIELEQTFEREVAFALARVSAVDPPAQCNAIIRVQH